MELMIQDQVKKKIIELRGENVLIDSDIAELYGVETKRINEAVKNNPEKFPKGYLFELTKKEWDSLKSKFSTSIKGGKVKLPTAFTEKGLYMMATILKSGLATETTLAIVETFTKVRKVNGAINQSQHFPEYSISHDRFLFYMDVLGTKNINKSGRNNFLIELITNFSKNNRKFLVDYEKNEVGVSTILEFEPEISSFSDHIAISFPIKKVNPFSDDRTYKIFCINSLINFSSQIHHLGLSYGFLVRGSITRGSLLHHDKIIVGAALDYAAELEKDAKHAITIIDKKVISDVNIDCYPEMISRIFDEKKHEEKFFVNYFRNIPTILGNGVSIKGSLGKVFSKMNAIIKRELEKSEFYPKDAKEKWEWLNLEFKENLKVLQDRHPEEFSPFLFG